MDGCSAPCRADDDPDWQTERQGGEGGGKFGSKEKGMGWEMGKGREGEMPLISRERARLMILNRYKILAPTTKSIKFSSYTFHSSQLYGARYWFGIYFHAWGLQIRIAQSRGGTGRVGAGGGPEGKGGFFFCF